MTENPNTENVDPVETDDVEGHDSPSARNPDGSHGTVRKS